MKILHVIFSCNRLKYLTKTLDSLSLLDYGDNSVDRLIIDDYPRTRNDAIFDLLCKTHGFISVLHKENLGLSVTWSELFNYIKTSNYDYILHQEDDVVLLEPVKVDDLIAVLESDEKIASVVLHRQPWYFHETETKIEETDSKIGNYYFAKNNKTFSPMFSLYRKSLVNYDFQGYWKFNLNEGMIMVYLEYFHQMYSAVLKNSQGKNIILHIGEESTGKRLLEGEPNQDQFAHMDPNKTYTSRTGVLVE